MTIKLNVDSELIAAPIEKNTCMYANQHMQIAKSKKGRMAEAYPQRRDEPASSPGSLFDFLISYLRLKNDADLARKLSFSPPRISKMRHLINPVSGEVLIRMHEVSNLSIRQLRALMGDHRTNYGIDD